MLISILNRLPIVLLVLGPLLMLLSGPLWVIKRKTIRAQLKSYLWFVFVLGFWATTIGLFMVGQKFWVE